MWGQQARTWSTLIPILLRIKSAGNASTYCCSEPGSYCQFPKGWLSQNTDLQKEKAEVLLQYKWTIKNTNINEGALIKCFLFLFFSKICSFQKSLLLNHTCGYATRLFFKANLLYDFYVVWKLPSGHTVVLQRCHCLHEFRWAKSLPVCIKIEMIFYINTLNSQENETIRPKFLKQSARGKKKVTTLEN